MPLDAQDVVGVFVADGLDDAFVVTDADVELGGGGVDGLVVEGVDLDFAFAGDVGEAAFFSDVEGFPSQRSIPDFSAEAADVFDQGATEEDVDQLVAPADSQDGLALTDRSVQESVLQGIAS